MSSSDTVGRSLTCTSVIRCDTMRNTFSSMRALPGSNASCRISTDKTTMTLSSPSSPQEWSEDATVSERTSPWRSSRSPRKTFSNTAPTPSTLSTSAARSSHSTIYIQLQLVGGSLIFLTKCKKSTANLGSAQSLSGSKSIQLPLFFLVLQ